MSAFDCTEFVDDSLGQETVAVAGFDVLVLGLFIEYIFEQGEVFGGRDFFVLNSVEVGGQYLFDFVEFFLLELSDVVQVGDHVVAQLSLHLSLQKGLIDELLLFSVHVFVAVEFFEIFGFVEEGHQVVAQGESVLVTVLDLYYFEFDFGAHVCHLFLTCVRAEILSLSSVSSFQSPASKLSLNFLQGLLLVVSWQSFPRVLLECRCMSFPARLLVILVYGLLTICCSYLTWIETEVPFA